MTTNYYNENQWVQNNFPHKGNAVLQTSFPYQLLNVTGDMPPPALHTSILIMSV